MHGAKGLEFDCVYVLGVQQSRMPGRRRSQRAGPGRAAEGGAARDDAREAHVAEMRRLLYVAMTRARKRLVLSWPERRRGAGDQTEQKPSPFYEEARAALGADEEERNEELLGIHEDLYAAFRMLRDEVMSGVAQVGARMGEMRLDAHLDAAGAIARYMELLKLASLIERHPRAGGAARARSREINSLITQTRERRAARDLPGLEPRRAAAGRPSARTCSAAQDRGASSPRSRWRRTCRSAAAGLMLSATDIDVYRTCPLRYKFARVYSIPQGADAPAALRDPGAPGARALPLAARQRGG